MIKKKIAPELYQKLQKLNEKKIAMDQFMKQTLQMGQDMMAEMNLEVRRVWEEIGRNDPTIDMKSIDWAPSTEKDTIVAIQQKFFPVQ